MNNQSPNTNNQIMTKVPMTEIPKKRFVGLRFGQLDIGSLGFIWDLEIGYWNLIQGRSNA